MNGDRHDLDLERTHALVRAYLDADYRWSDGDAWRRIVIGAAAPEVERADPHAATFGVLTAWNPGSVARAEADNRAVDRELLDVLQARGLPYRPALARDVAGGWREPGWLVIGPPPAAFDALAARFGQLGTLFWRRGATVRLRIAMRRPPGMVDDDLVDWRT